jgi:hypothetical protein
MGDYMKMISIKKFCAKHGACDEGKAWALGNCQTMLEVWVTVKPAWLLWIVMHDGVLTDNDAWLFALFCVRQTGIRSNGTLLKTVNIIERYIKGEATVEDIKSAQGIHSPSDIVWMAVYGAPVSEAEQDARADYLRSNCVPNFEEKI